MKKLAKILSVLVTLSILATLVVIFAGCSSVSVTNADELKDALLDKKTNISIESDIELFAREGLLQYGIMTMKRDGYTINGNGHTITIKGDDGLLHPYANGLFESFTNSTISNLNIVYNLKPTASKSSGWGGLAQTIESTTLTNVHVTYKKGLAYKGNTDNSVGGLVGLVKSNCTIQNCSVTGAIDTSGYCVGGVVGTLYESSTLSNSSFSGSIYAQLNYEEFHEGEYRAYQGGLVGRCYGNVSNCSAEISDFTTYFTGYSGYRAKEADVGLLCGYMGGKLSNCYVDISNNASISFDKSSGTFPKTMHNGLICGHLANGAKVKNVYVDATKWTDTADTAESFKQRASIGFGDNDTTNVEHVYYVDNGAYMYKDTFTVPFQIVKDETGSFEYTKNNGGTVRVDNARHLRIGITKEFLGRENAIYLEVIIDNSTGEWIYDDATIDVYDESSMHVWSEVQKPSTLYASLYKFAHFSHEDWNWEILIVLDMNAETATVTVTRQFKVFNFDDYVTCVVDYSGVQFDDGGDVIGQDTSDFPWTTDSNGKPVFKNN